MDLLTLSRILLRRWYVLAIFIVATGLGVSWTYQNVEPTYQTTASTLLLNPPAQTDPETGRSNPYVGNLGVAGQVVTNVINSPAKRRELRASGATGAFELGVEPTSPIIGVISTGRTAEESTTTTTAVMDMVDEVLADRQRQLNAPRNLYVTTQVVTPPSEPVPLNGSRTRAALALLALGLASSFGAAFAVEGLVRRSAPSGRSGAAPTTGGPDERDVVCPFCQVRLGTSELMDHLGSEHRLQAVEGEQSVYPLPTTRGPSVKEGRNRGLGRSSRGG